MASAVAIENLKAISSDTRGYISPTEFVFPDEHSQAIIRVTSYHRKDYCHSVICFPPREHDHVRLSISTSFPRDSSLGLGALSRLPLDLLHDIFLRLDIRSLLRLRQTNCTGRRLVDSVHEYQLVIKHGLDLFCALLRTKFAVNISLFDFYQTMCTKECTFCGDFAGFVTILVWKRCCFQCLRESAKIHVQTRAAVQKTLRLTNTESNQLRSLLSLPGVYSLDDSTYKSRYTLVSTHEATILSQQPSHAVSQSVFASSSRTQKYRFMASCALAFFDKRTRKADHGVSCAGCQFALENDITGINCESWAFEVRNLVYDEAAFLAHFRWCQQAQFLWISSDQGKKKPPALPEAARRWGFFGQGACIHREPWV